MATYKVIQDIEAEDKILGPLTLRQFIYAGITALLLYLCYFLFSKGLGFMIVVFLPPAFVFGFFAFPWGRDQPTEVWALAKIRFLLKPRRKIWNQSGIKELVTITAPKIEHENYGSNLSQTEVKSRLRALADTIDSRGWAIKNTNVNLSALPQLRLQQPLASDRLLDPSALARPQAVSAVDIRASDDILDERNNPRAQQMQSMITASTQAHHQKLIDELRESQPTAPSPVPANNYWFLNQPATPPPSAPQGSVTFNTQVVEPGTVTDNTTAAGPPVDEAALVKQLEEQKEKSPNASYYGHLHTIQPLSEQRKQAAKKPPVQATPPVAAPQPQPMQAAVPPPAPPVTPAKQAAILQLASNDDLNVATIAREAKRSEPNEVVIKLH